MIMLHDEEYLVSLNFRSPVPVPNLEQRSISVSFLMSMAAFGCKEDIVNVGFLK